MCQLFTRSDINNLKWYNFCLEFLKEECVNMQIESDTEEQKNTETWKAVLDIIETLVITAILFILINFASARVRVDGYSMVPTLQDGEFLFVNKLSYKFDDPARGDIIVFHYPPDPSRQDLIKRVIGIPGDVIVINDHQVTVNGQILSEPYIAEDPQYHGEWVVPKDNLFVLGDNRNDSSDSHVWGLLPMNLVVGKSIFIYWPIPQWQMIDHYDIARISG